MKYPTFLLNAKIHRTKESIPFLLQHRTHTTRCKQIQGNRIHGSIHSENAPFCLPGEIQHTLRSIVESMDEESTSEKTHSLQP